VRIAAVGSAFPPNYYDQDTLLAAFRRHWADRVFNLDRLDALHRNVLVGGRHLALPMEAYEGLATWGQANDAWIAVAQQVGEQAVRDGLKQAGLATDDVGVFVFVTVTGVATPSIDARLMNRRLRRGCDGCLCSASVAWAVRRAWPARPICSTACRTKWPSCCRSSCAR
jgi:alkylresorcinol/alkylpyrone synthase